MEIVKIGPYQVGQGHPLLVMAGPCVLEGYERSLAIGKRAKAICEKLGLPYVFKASYDKANRSSLDSFRGPGLEEGLQILAQIKKDLGVPVISDVHETWQVEKRQKSWTSSRSRPSCAGRRTSWWKPPAAAGWSM